MKTRISKIQIVAGHITIRLERRCPECGGSGYDWEGGQCYLCAGTGEID